MQIKWSAIIIWLLIILAGLMVLYIFHVPYVYDGINWVFTQINSIKIGDLPTQILGYFTADPTKALTTIISVAGAAGTIYGLYRTWKQTQITDQLQQQKLQLELTANNQLTQLQTQAQQQAQQYQTQIDGYKNQITQNLDWQSQLTESQNIVTQYANKIQSLQEQNQALMTQLANTPVKIGAVPVTFFKLWTAFCLILGSALTAMALLTDWLQQTLLFIFLGKAWFIGWFGTPLLIITLYFIRHRKHSPKRQK